MEMRGTDGKWRWSIESLLIQAEPQLLGSDQAIVEQLGGGDRQMRSGGLGQQGGSKNKNV